MITSFSRGAAGAAIFAQMLYENGLVNAQGQVLIPPGTVGAVSAALIIDPVLTSLNGNMEFPPGVENLTIVQAQNEYRTDFEAANYTGDNATLFQVLGNHGDTGDLYDNGLGGIYLAAYASFFTNTGLKFAPVPNSRAYDPSSVVVHSESQTAGQILTTGDAWDRTYNNLLITDPNYLTVARQTVPYGTNGVPVTVSGNATAFTAYNGDIVVGGKGYNIDTRASSASVWVLLPDRSASVTALSILAAVRLTQGDSLNVVNPSNLLGEIIGFNAGDTIDLAGIGTATGALLGTNNVLTVSGGGGGPINLYFDPTQSYNADSFLVTPDGNGGTDITTEADAQSVTFTGINEVLLVVNPGSLTGTIFGFGSGDVIDLAGIGTPATATLGANNVLTVSAGSGGSIALQLDPSENYGSHFFTIESDRAGGSDVGLYTISPLDVPLSPTYTYTLPTSVNNTGQITGYYEAVPGVTRGFLDTAGNITSFAVSGVNNIDPTSINNNGQVTGYYRVAGNLQHGFLYSAGSVTTFDPPGSSSTFPTSMNDVVQITGYYTGPNGQILGFLDSAGSISSFELPSSVFTKPTSINVTGQITGYYKDAGGYFHGFVDEGGAFTSFDAPGSGGTFPTSINNAGQITGYYYSGGGAYKGAGPLLGFIDTAGNITSFGVSGSNFTEPMSINDVGDVTGFYVDAQGHSHGFVDIAGNVTTFNVSSSTDTLPSSISDTGEIVGSFVGAGQVQGFVATPGAFSAIQIPCFCAGTNIRTESGETAVEDLCVGQPICLASGATARIMWLGHRHVDCRRQPTPRNVWPVCVSAQAFGLNLPHHDLWLSPDHAVFVDGLLIPIKLLINGSTIRQIPVDTVVYYHIELPWHDLLLAEGLSAESYLDTGNRSTFESANAALTLHPDFASTDGQARRVAGSCAPFADDPDRVKPIWQRLATRALTLGIPLPVDPDTTNDPALRLASGERVIAPISADSGRYVFVVPRTDEPVYLVSRAAIPCDLKPWVSDQRLLGVMVSRLVVRTGDVIEPIPLDHPLLTEGWWQPERNGAALYRWTDGKALLVLPVCGPDILEVTVALAIVYPVKALAELEQDAATSLATANERTTSSLPIAEAVQKGQAA